MSETPRRFGTPLTSGDPSEIGPFRLLGRLGQGGMAVVYLAEQGEPLEREVALKVLPPGAASEEALARFRGEQRTLARLSHDNIAAAYDAGETDDGRPYIAMEVVEGEPITGYCDARGLSVKERLGLFREVCDAVRYAHERGVIHRDIKPSNIVVVEIDGRAVPKLIDFGIAKLVDATATRMTQTGSILGTPQYMSPEQLRLGEEEVTLRSDVYSLGVVLYELLVGALPLSDEAYRAFGGFAVAHVEFPTPARRFDTLSDDRKTIAERRGVSVRQLKRQLAGEAGWVVLKAIDREPRLRYESAGEFSADVERLLQGEPTLARPRAVLSLSRAVSLLAIALGGVLMAQLATEFGEVTAVEPFELETLDLRQTAAAEQLKLTQEGTEVVLVFFDEEAISEWPYLSPFPRREIATLIGAISAAGARTIGLDVFLGNRFPQLNEWDGGDDLLREAIEDAGNVILVAQLEVVDGQPALIQPDTFFAEVAADVASADLPSPFETIRDGTMAVRSRGGFEPSFALALWAHSRGIDLDPLLAEATVSARFELDALSGSLDAMDDGGPIISFPLRFIGPPSHMVSGDLEMGTFSAMSSSRVHQMATLPTALEAFFRDKIVLLGTGFHESDQFRTPYYGSALGDMVGAEVELADDDIQFGWMYGVEVHAHALHNMISGEYIRVVPEWLLWLMVAIMSLTVVFVVFVRGTFAGFAATLAISAGSYFLAFSLYLGGVPGVERFLWMPVVMPAVGVWISYLGATAYVSWVEGRFRRLNAAFELTR